ncbi:MAG: FAD-binding oxidoreductase [Anaerolineae bacterium]|nr:MAG: FAD-binding oxidoreductase [Anaerolineae bacterium]
MHLPKSAQIVIIGGGVMGASTAYHLAQAGAKDVLLLERTAHLEDSATSRCAGGVRYQFATEVNIQLSKVSLPMLERFKDEIGIDPLYRQCGYFFVLTEPSDVETFRSNVALQRSLGVETEWLEGDEVRQLLPLMQLTDALAGTVHEKDGLADPSSVNIGYLDRARDLGVHELMETEVVGIDVVNGRVAGVETARGHVACEHVVNAAGPWAGEVGKYAGLKIPIQPIRRQMVTTTPLPLIPDDFPFVIDFAQSLYFHREGEGLLTGMSNRDQEPGFDQKLDDAWEARALEAAMERLPLLETAGRLSGWAGLYEVTPDAHPIFGPTRVDGFWIVAGFSGHGFMHGPVAGKLMSEIILEGRASTVDVSMLDLARFDEGRLIQEYNVV